MKYTITKISEGENEVILKYHSLTPEVERLVRFLNNETAKLVGNKAGMQVVVEIGQILYIESVEGRTYAYLERDVVRLKETLGQLEQRLGSLCNFFRCSKSMILNIDKVERLKSLPSNRIDAIMCNGEHVRISRTYASEFRRRLKGGGEYE